ncbi:MAG: hypothetical protein ACI37Z_09205 [Candidatus Gastranaerophilaceae bacterium]
MKKIFTTLLLVCLGLNMPISAVAVETSKTVKAPVWEEYAPEKYQNPRSFPNKGKNISELAVGVVLTDLLLTAPIGIPMICHATTKMKNESWYKKKIIFDAGLKEAEKIQDPVKKQEYYVNLLKKCKLTEERHQKQLAKMQKKTAKNDK